MRAGRTLILGSTLTLLGFSGAGQASDRAPTDSFTGTVNGKVVFEADQAGIEVTEAIVYLVGEGLSDAKPAPEKPVLDQRDITFSPHVLAVGVDQELEIHNNDGILHNVKTLSRENRPFNKAQVGSAVLRVTFDRPEVITVVCNVHSQMSAYLVVVPNGFVTRVGPDGAFSLDEVPPGTYELVAWHEDFGAVTSEVVVTSNAPSNTVINFTR